MSDKGKIELSLGLNISEITSQIKTAKQSLYSLADISAGKLKSKPFGFFSDAKGESFKDLIGRAVGGEVRPSRLAGEIRKLDLGVSLDEMSSAGKQAATELSAYIGVLTEAKRVLTDFNKKIKENAYSEEGIDEGGAYFATRDYSYAAKRGKGGWKGGTLSYGEKVSSEMLANPKLLAHLQSEGLLATQAEVEAQLNATNESLAYAKNMRTEVKEFNSVVGSGVKIIEDYNKARAKKAQATRKENANLKKNADATEEAIALELEKIKKENAASKSMEEQAANLYRLNAAYTLFSNVLRTVVKGVTSLVEAYAQADQAQTRFNLNFAESEGAAGLFNQQVENTITYLSKIKGFSASGLRTVANDFYEMVRSFGVAKTEASAFTSTFVQDVAQISRATGQSLDTVASAIQRAVATGESEAVLNQLNIDLRKTTLKSWMVEKGLIEDKNAEINEGLRSLATQLYLHEQIANNENLSKNRGQEQLVAQERIRNNLEEIKQTGGSILSAIITPATKKVASFTGWLNKITGSLKEISPFAKGLFSFAILIPSAMVATLSAVIAIKAAQKKLNILLYEQLGLNSAIEKKIKSAAGWVGIMSTSLILVGSVLAAINNAKRSVDEDAEKSGESLESTSNITESIAENLKNVQEESKKAKGSLMGFDKLNVLSMGTSNVDTTEMASVWDEQQSSLSSLNEEIAKYNDNLKTSSVLTSLITASLSGAALVSQIYTKATAKRAAAEIAAAQATNLTEIETEQKKLATLRAAGADAAAIAPIEAKIASLQKENLTLDANIRKQYVRRSLAAGVIGLLSSFAIAGIAAGASSSATKSANGNFFPRASTTVIGEKYPEVAIPLGQSPQYAEMKQSIAKSVVEMLGGQAGEIKIVNQTVLDGRVIDERIRKVSRQDYKNQTGSNYKNVAMRK